MAQEEGLEPSITVLETAALAAKLHSHIGTAYRCRSCVCGATTRRSTVELRQQEWSLVPVSNWAPPPYESAVFAGTRAKWQRTRVSSAAKELQRLLSSPEAPQNGNKVVLRMGADPICPL